MAKNIAVIREELKECDVRTLAECMAQYREDERGGVQKLLAQAQKRIVAYEAELARTEKMKHYEKLYPELRYVGGIDEVGRGPLAGPVVACCVVLPKDCDILYLNDSKQVPEKRREALCDEILTKAVSVGIGVVSPQVIDEVNILQATYRAMREAVEAMEIKPEHLLVDAVTIPGIAIPQRGIIHGDAKSISIAAASIVAKVTRDHMMEEYARTYPHYDFASNKGYGTKEHIEALKAYGPCEIHRRSFIGNFIN